MIKKIYNTHKETIHNFLWRSLQILGKQGITFLIFLLCAKLLIPYEFGVYNYVLAIIFFLIVFGDFGISTATSKYVAEYNVNDKEKLRCVLFNSGIVILVLTVIVASLTLLFGKSFLGDKYIYVLYLLPLIFLAPMTSLYDGIYRGLKKFKQLAVISIIVGVISIIFVYFLIKQYGLIGALISQNLFYLILLIALGIGHKEFHFKFNKEVIKEVGKYSLIIGVADIGLFFYTQIGSIVLGQLGYFNEIGYYELVNKLFTFLFLPTILLATVIAPNTTKDFALKKFKELKTRMIRGGISLFVIGLLIAVVSYLIFPSIFRFFLPQYDLKLLTLTLNLLLILIPLRYFSSYISIGYITPCGFAKITATLLVSFGVLNLLLSILLGRIYGFVGIIYATLISQILFILVKDIYFYIKLKNLSKRTHFH